MWILLTLIGITLSQTPITSAHDCLAAYNATNLCHDSISNTPILCPDHLAEPCSHCAYDPDGQIQELFYCPSSSNC
jgi:hypothetical protein